MKKRKTIGLVVLLFILFGVIGFTWYRENIYVGVNDVKAVSASNDNKCNNSANVNINIDSNPITVNTKGSYNYTVKIYVIDPTPDANDAEKTIDDAFLVYSENITGSQKITYDYSSIPTAGKEIVVDVIWNTKSGSQNISCKDRKTIELPDPSALKNLYTDACDSWFSGDKIEFKYNGKNYTLNKDIADYQGVDGKLQEFQNFKRERIGNYCNANVSYNGSREEFMYNLYILEGGFNSWYQSRQSVTSTDNTNANIGNPDDYEDMTSRGTTIDTLYCKTNSVYLKDVDQNNENKLEDSNTNDKGLKYENRGANSVLDTSGTARANLYLFKYTKTEKEQYTVYVNGQPSGEAQDACEVSCTEYLKVNFDPPQAVKAGVCFSYAVQVIAYTECEAVNTSPVPSPPVTESALPSCTGHANYAGEADEAGPNDEFDSCILKCDGGKYTDDCSVKCLNEVYGADKKTNSAKGLSLYDGKVLGKFMANDSDACPSWNAPKEVVHNFFKTHSSGSFYKNASGKIVFKSNYPNCYWAQYAPYYLSDSKAPGLNMSQFDYTYSTDIHFRANSKYGYAPSCLAGAGCQSGEETSVYGGPGYRGTVVCDKSTLGQEFPTGCRSTCEATCTFKSNSSGSYGDVGQTSEDYRLTMESYNQAIEKCSATAVCKSDSTPTTSTFYIGVNEEADKWSATNDTDGTDRPQRKGQGTECVGGNNSSKIIQGRKSTEDSLALGTGGLCYCGNEDYAGWHHYTRWTFPGSWVAIKTGKIQDTPPKEGEQGYYNGGYNRYCTPEDSDNINVAWQTDYLANYKKHGTEKDARSNITYSDGSSIKWNIFARTEDFGNYGWKIDMRCFYSVSKDSTVCPPEICDDTCDGTDGSCDNVENTTNQASILTNSSNIKTKVADVDNILPSSAGGKKVAFNWSDAATKLDIVDEDDNTVYEIVPGAYRNYVEEVVKDDVFTDEYLDYQFYLTGSDMREIVKSSGTDYGIYNGDGVAIVGFNKKKSNSLYAYKSDLIRKYAKNGGRVPTESALKCNNLDSSSGPATRCATTDNGVIPETNAVSTFKSNKKAADRK